MIIITATNTFILLQIFTFKCPCFILNNLLGGILRCLHDVHPLSDMPCSPAFEYGRAYGLCHPIGDGESDGAAFLQLPYRMEESAGVIRASHQLFLNLWKGLYEVGLALVIRTFIPGVGIRQ